MLKQLVILLLGFGAGVLGNLVAGWIQQERWSNVFTLDRVLSAVAGVGLMLVILAWLESEWALPWNWAWHRYWYLWELRKNRELQRWQTGFARLELARRPGKIPAAEVMVGGERRDLVEVLRDLIVNQRGAGRRALILGEPGSGKTTGLEGLTLALARAGVRRLGFGWPIPVLVRLGNFQTGDLLEYAGQAM